MSAPSRRGLGDMETAATGRPESPASSTSKPASKREQVPVACSRCRVHKVKVQYIPPLVPPLNHPYQSCSVMEYARRALVASLAKHRVNTMWRPELRDKSPSSARPHLSKRRINNYTQYSPSSVPDSRRCRRNSQTNTKQQRRARGTSLRPRRRPDTTTTTTTQTAGSANDPYRSRLAARDWSSTACSTLDDGGRRRHRL